MKHLSADLSLQGNRPDVNAKIAKWWETLNFKRKPWFDYSLMSTTFFWNKIRCISKFDAINFRGSRKPDYILGATPDPIVT